MPANRHRRQKLLGWLDEEAQARIERATVVVSRVGGLGGPLAQSLAVAGVGRIVFWHESELLDEDLHRMVLMDPDGVGRARAPQAEESLRRLVRPGAEVLGFASRVTEAEAARWMAEADLAVGAAPTYEERLILSDAAVRAGKPFLDAAMYADETHVFCARPTGGPCFRCLVPTPPPWRHDFPVLGAVSAMVGNLAASICVRILAGGDGVPWAELVHLDAEQLRLVRTPVPADPECAVCRPVRSARPAAGAHSR